MSSYPSRARRFSIPRASILYLLTAVATIFTTAALAFTASAQQARGPASDTATRGFLASWHLDDATPLGPEVRVRLSLRISNYTGIPYSSATLSLRDPLDPGAKLASIPVLLTARDESLALTADVTLPAREYRRWQKGASPHFVLEFNDSSGKLRSFPVELIRMPVREAR